jgi:hypothetical protein
MPGFQRADVTPGLDGRRRPSAVDLALFVEGMGSLASANAKFYARSVMCSP